MNIFDVNWIAVIAAAVTGFIVGGIWYGPIMGKQWLGAVGLTEEQIIYAGGDSETNIGWEPEWQPLSIVNGGFEAAGDENVTVPDFASDLVLDVASNIVPGWSHHGGGGFAHVGEKPDEIASAVLDWLNQLPPRKGSES